MLGGLGDSEKCLELSVMSAIMPLIEGEVAMRAEERISSMKDEVDKWKGQYESLLSRHELLLQEMERSRKIFEKKCREWQVIKDALSQKERFRSLLNSSEQSPAKNSEVLFSTLTPVQKDREEISTCTTDDPVNLLIMSTQLPNEIEIPFELSSPIETPAPKVTTITPLKRQSPKFSEAMRNKAERKQAHAKDCSCCTKVIFFWWLSLA